MEGPFKENDFVWAKMASYNHWPAIITLPVSEGPPRPGSDYQWVYFLGSHNYAWIKNKNIKPYEEFKEQYKKKKDTEPAQHEMEEIMRNMAEDPNYKIPFVKLATRSTPLKRSDPSTPASQKRPLKEKNTPATKKRISQPLSDVGLEKVLMDKTSENSSVLNTENLPVSNHYFGFLAGHIYAEGIIKNLINTGHRLYVWSSSSTLTDELQAYSNQHRAFFKVCNSPAQVMRNSNITFSCMDDEKEARQNLLQIGGATLDNDLLTGRGYVEMTSIEPSTSKDFQEIVEKDGKGGLYMEAMLQGGRQEAVDGDLLILAAGMQSLFLQCQSCFKAISKASLFLGKVGTATGTHKILQLMRGVILSGFTEGFVMADRCGIKLDMFNHILKTTNMSSPYLKSKGDMIVNKKFASTQDTEEPLEQLQHDVASGLVMADKYKQPMPLAAHANESLLYARRLGCDGQDSACIFRHRY